MMQEVRGTKQAGVYGVSDDNNKQMKRICDALAAAKDGTLVETELKSALGFKCASTRHISSFASQADSVYLLSLQKHGTEPATA